MERLWILVCLILGITACSPKNEDPVQPDDPDTSVLAFPGAEGGGQYVAGGRGTSIHVIYSLEDDHEDPQSGTLRYALEKASGPRVIAFSVSGRIDLDYPIQVKHGQVTILGQTAPGDGICVSGFPVVINADDVIIRYMRFRMGDLKKAEGDALTVEKGHKNIIIDHCSFSWSTDECVSVYGVENFTLQYCFITESLNSSVHAKGAHGYGGIWGGKNVSFHHNLLAHHNSRNPRFDHDYVDTQFAGPIDYVNNVVFNWGSNSTYGGEGTNKGAGGRHINMVNNYYKYGPATSKKNRLVDPTVSCNDNCAKSPGGTVQPGKFFLSGNYMYGDENVTADNWKGSTQTKSKAGTDTRWTDGMSLLTNEQTAEDAFEKVLAKAGCSLSRDEVDMRIVEDVRNGVVRNGKTVTSSTVTGGNGSKGGLIDTPDDVGGWPTYSGTTTDSDFDGIPDEWESSHGLNPNDRKDAAEVTLQKPYMNIEVYANDLVKDLY